MNKKLTKIKNYMYYDKKMMRRMFVDMFNFLKQRFDFKCNFFTFVCGIWSLVICPLILYAPKDVFVEDGWIENLQLLFLVCTLIISYTATTDKKFFMFVGLLVILMLMRETNLGRYYFCEKYLSSDVACKWKNLKYGYFAEILRWGFGLYTIYFAWINRLYLNFINYVKSTQIFFWDILFVFLGALGGSMAELHFIDNEIMEEASELLFYLAFTNCVWRYSRLKI